MSLTRKPSSTNVVTQTDQLPDQVKLPEASGRIVQAFPEFGQWVASANVALNEFWNSVHNVLQRRNDEVVLPLNQNLDASAQSAKTLQQLNEQLVAIQKTVQNLGADASLLKEISEMRKVIDGITTFGAGLIDSENANAAKVKLGLKPGDAVALVVDATATAPVVTDVGAVFSQTILNANFQSLESSVNALIVDVDDIRQKLNKVISNLSDQNLIAKL